MTNSGIDVLCEPHWHAEMWLTFHERLVKNNGSDDKCSMRVYRCMKHLPVAVLQAQAFGFRVAIHKKVQSSPEMLVWGVIQDL